MKYGCHGRLKRKSEVPRSAFGRQYFSYVAGEGPGGIDTDTDRSSRNKEGNKFNPLIILFMLPSWQSHKTMEPMIFAYLLAGVRFDLNRV